MRKKRRLVIDELKSIASETMKLQLSDTSEIVSTLDLAPPTKKLMHWKETGGVEKLFAFPGRQIVSRKLSRVSQSINQSIETHLYSTGVSNSRPEGRMRPAKALFAARDTLSEIKKIWDNNKSF